MRVVYSSSARKWVQMWTERAISPRAITYFFNVDLLHLVESLHPFMLSLWIRLFCFCRPRFRTRTSCRSECCDEPGASWCSVFWTSACRRWWTTRSSTWQGCERVGWRCVCCHPIYYCRPSFSLSLLVVTQIRCHIAGSSPSSRLRFVPCIFIARRVQPLLPSSPRVELRLPTLGALSRYTLFVFAKYNSKPHHGGIPTPGPTLFIAALQGTVTTRAPGRPS